MTFTTKTTSTFQELGLGALILKALKENGFEAPFPIQEAVIPLALTGVDVIGQAHTGTGKTAAFALPILTKIKIRRNGPIQALILVPTRELALQVTNEFNKFAKYTGIRTVAIYGGQSIVLQYNQLRRGIQIVVATPGRLIDHVRQGSIQLDDVKFVVLDEADRMLDMGFIDDIKFILSYLSEDRQRGIDVPAVGHVINYDVPMEPLMYFHRIGRTARAGATGKAISLVSQDRINDFGRILRKTEQPIRRLNEEMGIAVPTHKRPYDRSRPRHSYWHNSGGHGGNRNTRNHRGQRDDNRSSRYGRDNRSSRYGRDNRSSRYGRDNRSSRYGRE